jgi:hypothetical protein
MRDNIFNNRYPAGFVINLDDRDMGGIAPGDSWRLPVKGFFEPAIDPRRTAMVPARARRLR